MFSFSFAGESYPDFSLDKRNQQPGAVGNKRLFPQSMKGQ
jgi:hypothetical protein